MNRGDILTVVAAGDYGKPRPAVVIQSDVLKSTDSVLVCLMTSMSVDAPIFRLRVDPDETNGLRVPSYIMTDKILAVPRTKCGPVIGQLDRRILIALKHMLAVVIGIAD